MQPSVSDANLSLFVTDIDNTLFDWVSYYVHAFGGMLKHVEKTLGIPYQILAAEAKDVFVRHGSIEYPFLVQELPSVVRHFGDDIDAMLGQAVRPARLAFNAAAEPFLKPYEGVEKTLAELKKRHPTVPIVALTDAPRYVAMWKLNKLGLLPRFDAVYGLPDPRIPTSAEHGRVKVDPEILLKHLQQNDFGFTGRIRVLPDDYEKPGTKGLKMVLMDHELDEDPVLRHRVVWVGDNQRKDVGLGRKLGVRTAWAAYGRPDPQLVERLIVFSPPQNIHKNAALDGQEAKDTAPDWTLAQFSDLLAHL